jgi:MFS family permease
MARLSFSSIGIHNTPLYLAVFLDLAGFGMVLPDIQTRLESFGAHGGIIGATLAVYFLTQMLVSPLWGNLSDKWGRKPILLVCGSLSAASMVVYALAHSVPMLFFSRILAGFAAANVVVAQAYLADTTSDRERTKVMGRVGMATTAGLILGPALGGWLAERGGNFLTGSVAAIASSVGVLWIALGVPMSPPREQRMMSARPSLSLLREFPALRGLFLLSTIAYFVLACLEGTFGRLLRARFGYGPGEFGLIFGYEALLGVLVQGFVLPRLSQRFAPVPILSLAYALQGLGLGMTPFVPNLAGLFLASTLFAPGVGLASPMLNSLCSAATPSERQGEMFGLLQAVRSFGFLIGPILGGLLFDWKPPAPYVLAGGVALTVSLLVPHLMRNAPKG